MSRSIVLGVSGSVAAYRAADLARELMRRGFVVRVCLTDAASQFVTPALFEALTGQPTLQHVFEEPIAGRMAHIDWARQADAIVIAPATANTINRLASGVGDDMLTTIALATTKPLLIAPAMNPQMYANDATRGALDTLSASGAVIVAPSEGDVACGEHGQGKLAPIDTIVEEVTQLVSRGQMLEGRRVLITSGPTREPIDSVRFLSNRSSGKMGAALARAALLLGAEVAVVSGPTSVPLPLQATVERVETARQMLDAARAHGQDADLILGAAAVADYRVEHPSDSKLRRSDEPMTLQLTPNPDVIATLAREFPSARVVGFAAEPGSDLGTARSKTLRKGLYATAVNDVSRPDIGFDADRNELTLVYASGETEQSGVRSKLQCALWLLERVGVGLGTPRESAI